MAEIVENAILHGTVTANNRVGFRIDSAKSGGKGNRNSQWVRTLQKCALL